MNLNNFLTPFTNLTSKQKLLFSGLGLFFLFVCFLIILILRGGESSAPLENNNMSTPRTQSPGKPITESETLNPSQSVQVVNKIVRNPEWLNETELAYTFYDKNELETRVERTNGKSSTNLTTPVIIKFMEINWSKKKEAVILELTSPIKTYYLTPGQAIRNINLQGYAYSWNPTGDQLFYIDYSNPSSPTPRYFFPSNQTSLPVEITLPSFTHSLWSPKGDSILLYTNAIDVEDKNPVIFNRLSNQIEPINADDFYDPSWSPKGLALAYLTNEGLYIKNSSGADTLLYKSTSSPQTTTFLWINEEEIFIIDSSKSKTEFYTVSLATKRTKSIFKNLNFAADQRIEIALSPSGKRLALATEKNGLYFINL